MSTKVKEKIEKLLHIGEYGKDAHKNDDDGASSPSPTTLAAPSPAIFRTQEAQDNSGRKDLKHRRVTSRSRPNTADATYRPRTVSLSTVEADGRHLPIAQQYTASDGQHHSTHLAAADDPFNEATASHNLYRHEALLSGSGDHSYLIDGTPPYKHRRSGSHSSRTSFDQYAGRASGEHSIRRTPNFSRRPNPAPSSDKEVVVIPDRKASLDWKDSASPTSPQHPSQLHHKAQKPTLQTIASDREDTFPTLRSSPVPSSPRHFISSSPIPLDGIVDLTNTEDTQVHESIAPAVTHETVQVDTKTIVTHQITRDIHNHDIFHRILPIHDIEVLPPRHFHRAADGTLVEIAEDQIPGGRAANLALQALFQQAADGSAKEQPRESGQGVPGGPRGFTARAFPGRDGDAKEFVAPEGNYRYTEQTWVHPPTLEKGGRDTGQTMAFHFPPDPAVASPRLSMHSSSRPGTSDSTGRARASSITRRKPVPGNVEVAEEGFLGGGSAGHMPPRQTPGGWI